MVRALFIMTHKNSNWEKLVDKLMEDNRFDFFQTGNAYHHPDDLKMLIQNHHRRENSAAIWCDVILRNQDFTCRALRDSCKFLYWQGGDIDEYRLQGMRWYHQKTGGPWLTSEVDFSLGSIYG